MPPSHDDGASKIAAADAADDDPAADQGQLE
jgi:hypothetical protein